ncbi:CpaF family protein [Actinokineospora pegani]|uniref:CpaF family protein n=1 Tax=Actinokineospora pegani TaxID=2654637 RepID=UPI0012E9A922|nr:ATPase, T2SS/T4P/T4SS family [Actinokineospora pegani]
MSAAQTRLRQAIRHEVAVELPQRVAAEVGAVDTGSIGEVRGTIARSIADSALRTHTEAELAAGRPPVEDGTAHRIVGDIVKEFIGAGGLQRWLDDPTVETIAVNRWDDVVVHHADGRRVRVAPVASSNDELTELVRDLARSATHERRLDQGSPALNLQLPGGQRLFAVLGLTSDGSTALTIRRHGYVTATLHQLRRRGSVDIGLESFLSALTRARKNVLITGGTSAGKTTLLRAMAADIDAAERLITIEDTLELGLEHDPTRIDVIALQARDANIEGEGAISQAELLRWALRMSPDRVIVGEIRGPEVIPMCNAMSQGNDGSLATLHASSSGAAFARLAAYAAQGDERLPVEVTNLLVSTGLHFVVHLARTKDRASRVVSSIREVVAADGAHVVTNEVYRPGPDNRARPVAGSLHGATLDDLADVGFDPDMLENPMGWWTS